MPTQNTVTTSRKASRAMNTEINTGMDASAEKSITDVITENLGEDVMSTVNQATAALSTTKSYVSDNRREAFMILAGVGAVAWAVLYTKPGRQLFNTLAPEIMPRVKEMVTSAIQPARDASQA